MSRNKYCQVGSKLDFIDVDVGANGHWTIETQQTQLINNFWTFVHNPSDRKCSITESIFKVEYIFL